MPLTTLWRLEPPTHPEAATRLAAPLVRHLRYAPLTAILLRHGASQQLYLESPGCAGCAQGRCEPGCRARLLERMLYSAGASAAIHHVTGGLTRRRYRQMILALPRRTAGPIDINMLAPVPEYRLELTWHNQHRLGVKLLVGDQGSAPLLSIRAAGWYAVSLPAGPFRQAPRVAFGGLSDHWSAAPYLPLLPVQAAQAALAPAALPAAPLDPALAALAEDGVAWLRACQEYQSEPAPPPVPDSCPPAANEPERFRALIEQIVASPLLTSGAQRSQIGLTVGRLAKAAQLPRPAAQELLARLDRAALLGPAANGDQRPGEPRPLVTLDANALLAQLQATSDPQAEQTNTT